MIPRRKPSSKRKPRQKIPKPYPLKPATFHKDGRVTLFLPVPHRIVSPNAGRGQSVGAAMMKYRATEAHKQAARLAMVDAIARFPGLGPFIGYTLSHFFKTSAYRDDDNADGACKAYRDGIAEALRINDRDLRKIVISEQARDAKCPRVEFTLHTRHPQPSPPQSNQ